MKLLLFSLLSVYEFFSVRTRSCKMVSIELEESESLILWMQLKKCSRVSRI